MVMTAGEAGEETGAADGTPAPHLAGGEIQLESPPELPEVTPDGMGQALMYLPMGAMTIGMVAVIAGGHASPVLFIGSGAMAVGMAGMMVGQLVRGRGDRKVKVNGQRRDYLRYLSQLRRRVRHAAEQQRRALEYRGPDPRSLPSLVAAGADQLWGRRPGGEDFGCARFVTGTQALAVRLVPPDTKPIEDLDPLCAGALRRFIRAQSQVPALPVEVALRSVTRVVVTGDRAAGPALVRALIAQLAVSHSPADVRISVCAPADRVGRWEWVKWLPHTRHPTEQDAAGPVPRMSPSLGGLAAMLGLADRARFSAAAAREAPGPGPLPLHVVVADGAAREPGADLAGLDGVVVIDLGGTGEGEPAGPGTLTLRVTADAVFRVARDGSADAYIGAPDQLARRAAEGPARAVG